MRYLIRPSINRHPDDSVNPLSIECCDFLEVPNATGRNELPIGRGAKFTGGRAIQPAEHAFAVDERREKGADVRRERADGVDRADRNRRLPPMNDDLPAAAVDGRDEWFLAEGGCEGLRLIDAYATGVEQRAPDDDASRAVVQPRARSVDRSDAAADLTRQRTADSADERVIPALTHRRVEIDHLHHRIRRELVDPRLHVVGLEREPFALHELHDAAVHEIDRRNQHAVGSEPLPDESHRHAARRQKLLQVADGVFGEMKDRRRECGICATHCEDFSEMLR